MRILYLAKHSSGNNDDEGAIKYALEKLGHEVLAFQEGDVFNAAYHKADFCLVHKHENLDGLRLVASRMPLVSWYFDLVHTLDPHLTERTYKRTQWTHAMNEICTLQFFTDGDWVDLGISHGKAHWLMQGADERYVGKGFVLNEPFADILFTGTPLHGFKREQHIQHLTDTWGSKFQVLGATKHQRRHGRELANVFATSKIIIAPYGPSTDRYWSNRVYLTTGFNGYLLHPCCESLKAQYSPEELTTYQSWDHLDELIDKALQNDPLRRDMAYAGYQATCKKHLYRHRCEELIRIVKERIE